jgi:DNA-directed RNA polymerase specialized sigma24 family protein
MRRVGNLDHVKNLESYLVGAFRHRFQRALLKEQRYRQSIPLMESIGQIKPISQIPDWKPVDRIVRELQVQQTVQLLDPWTRRVWNYLKYGYSIKEIARHLDLTEFQVEFRYRRRLARLRQYIARRPEGRFSGDTRQC